MKIRNLIEFTVDMTNKNEEIVRIINVYLSAIPTVVNTWDFSDASSTQAVSGRRSNGYPLRH